MPSGHVATAGRICGLIVLLAHAGPHADQTRPPRDVRLQPPPRSATAVISGRILDAEGEVPIRRAEVVAMSNGGEERKALTDAEGRFEFTGLHAGNWYLAASKTGYVRQQLGQRPGADAASAVTVADGQRLATEFRLARGGVVAGRVYDEYGEPLAGARVYVMRPRMVKQRRYLQRTGDGDLTDDTGAFRIHGLPPGEYYVAGSLRVATADSIVQTTHSLTYFPGTANVAEAQRVLVASGAHVQADFPLMAFRTARVSGVVLAAGGGPADAFLNLTSEAGELGVPLGFGGVTRPDGTFTLPEVPPGAYTLHATLRGDGSEVAAVPLAVYGEDVTDVVLVTSPPATVHGTIVADAGVTRPLPATVEIVARSVLASAEAAFAQAEGNRFELAVPAGPFHLAVAPPDGWAVRAIVVDGADVTDSRLDLRGQRGAPARVVLTNRVTEVSGTVTPIADAPVSIVVFPDDPAKWAPPTRYVRTVAAAARGAFRVTGLPGGVQYRAVAVEALEDGEGDDPEFLARVRDLATPFALADGEKLVIQLQVRAR